MKKNWFYLIPISLLCLPLLMVFYVSATYGYDFAESVVCLKAMGKQRTKMQGEPFTESKFRKIQPGMWGRQVFETIGMPLERHDGDTKWLYSLPVGGAKYYHERMLMMEKGQVSAVICRFHTPESN